MKESLKNRARKKEGEELCVHTVFQTCRVSRTGNGTVNTPPRIITHTHTHTAPHCNAIKLLEKKNRDREGDVRRCVQTNLIWLSKHLLFCSIWELVTLISQLFINMPQIISRSPKMAFAASIIWYFCLKNNLMGLFPLGTDWMGRLCSRRAEKIRGICDKLLHWWKKQGQFSFHVDFSGFVWHGIWSSCRSQRKTGLPIVSYELRGLEIGVKPKQQSQTTIDNNCAVRLNVCLDTKMPRKWVIYAQEDIKVHNFHSFNFITIYSHRLSHDKNHDQQRKWDLC